MGAVFRPLIVRVTLPIPDKGRVMVQNGSLLEIFDEDDLPPSPAVLGMFPGIGGGGELPEVDSVDPHTVDD